MAPVRYVRKRVVVSEIKTPQAGLERDVLLGEVFSASPDAVVVIDAGHRIVLASPAVTTLFGYGTEELLGESIDLLVPDSRKEVHVDHLRHFFEAPHPREMGVGLDLAGRRRDGVELPIDVSLTPVNLDGVLYVAAFVRDATERRRALNRLNAVNEITKRLLAGAQMQEILPLVAHSARLLCDSDAAWIVMQTSVTQFEIVSVDGNGTEVLLGVPLSVDTSRSAEVMRTGHPDVVDDLSTADNVPAGVVGLNLGPGLYVPFVADQRRLGTLVLGRVHGQPSYHPLDVAFAEVFAGAAATAIEMGSVRAEIDRLSIIAEDERIARDLHDTVIQELFALGMSLQALGSSATGAVGDRISAAVESLDDVIRQIRNTIFRLPGRNEVVTGLREEMLRLADRYQHELGVLPRIAFLGPVDIAVPEIVSEHLLHVFGEGLSNVGRHAQASKIEAVVAVEGEWLSFSLTDDGVGVGDGPSAGNGIRNMSTRAENLGGTFSVSRRDPKGTVVEWRVPLSPLGTTG
jgi:two-component system, NarL family, sensor histidine kinase DevS